VLQGVAGLAATAVLGPRAFAAVAREVHMKTIPASSEKIPVMLGTPAHLQRRAVHRGAQRA
jgi:hypothetical protein